MPNRVEELEEMAFKVAESYFKESVSSENLADEDAYFDDYLALTMGRYNLFDPTIQEVRNIINVSRQVWVASDIYKTALSRRKDFALGEFIEFNVIPRGIESVEQQLSQGLTDETTRQLNKNWDLFWSANRMSLRVGSLFDKWERDGTAYLRIFDNPRVPLVRFVDPLTVEGADGAVSDQPENSTILNSLGVVTDIEDTESVLGFTVKIIREHSEYAHEFVEAYDMLQLKSSVDFDSLVGLPLLYPVFTNMRRADTMLKNISVLTTIQTAIAMIRKHENANMAQMRAFQNRNATGSRRLVDEQTNVPTKRYHSGTILDAKSGTTYEFPAHGIEAAKWVIPIHEELSRVASAADIPVDWLLAKENEAPLSPGSPYIKALQARRAEFYFYMSELYWNIQERMGIDVESVRERYELLIDGPVTPTAKPLDQARIDDIHIKHSAKSPQQLAREHGRRYVIQRSEVIENRKTRQPDEQFPGDSGMTNIGGDGETKANGDARVAAGDGGNNA